ncbi:cytidine deaminase family protein, partial [Mesobacillus selenatarsenatis]
MDKKTLVEKAIDARSKAYVPYSKFQVGAAIITSNDHVYLGCNIE